MWRHSNILCLQAVVLTKEFGEYQSELRIGLQKNAGTSARISPNIDQKTMFYPPDNLRKYITLPLVQEVLRHCGPLKNPCARDVHSRFTQVLGVLIETRSIDFLQYFVSQDWDDDSLKKNMLSKDRLKHCLNILGARSDFIEDFWKTKRYFFLAKIRYDQLQTIDDSLALPIQFSDRGPIGCGGYGIVYECMLMPGFHDMPPYVDEFLAVKKFNSVKDWDNEWKQICEIHKERSHDYIIYALCAISHGQSHYIVFPRAKESLKTRMETLEPSQCQTTVSGVLENFTNLLDALQFLHNSANQSAWLYHFDLKPSNIVCLDDGSFVLIDFGTVHSKNNRDGTSGTNPLNAYSGEYAPPVTNKVGRGFDVWALGCIGLELMVWVTWGPTAVKRFRGDRSADQKKGFCQKLDRGQRSCKVSTAFFHTSNGDGPAQLSESVVARMDQFEKLHPEAITILQRMLEVDVSKRISAMDAWKQFRTHVNVSCTCLVQAGPISLGHSMTRSAKYRHPFRRTAMASYCRLYPGSVVKHRRVSMTTNHAKTPVRKCRYLVTRVSNHG